MIPDCCPECGIGLTPKRKKVLCSDCEDYALSAATLAPQRPGTVRQTRPSKARTERVPRPKAVMR